MMFLRKYWGVVMLMLLMLSIIGNILLARTYLNDRKHHEDPNLYPLLSPRIFAEKQNDILINFWELRTLLRKEVATYDETFAVYFEYLPTGVSVGIHEKDNFVAASLIKLPIAIAYLYQQENSGLSRATSDVTIKKSDIDNGFGSLWQSGEGATISLDKALELSIVQSDNTASNVLKSHVQMEHFNKVYEGLDIEVLESGGKVYISAKSYASIFKSLYFASLISKKSSERLLQLMTQTSFNDKLVASVPPHIKVAHKIGVFENESTYQDCGIVYEPNRPYILCMFSRSTEDIARQRMNSISKIVYDFVSHVNRD